MVRYVVITPWGPTNKELWYSDMILSVHDSGIANKAFSLSGIMISLNSN